MVSRRGQLRLNEESYVLAPVGRNNVLWQREKVVPFAPVQSTTTFQSPETFQNYRVISISSFLGGLGRRRVPSEEHADPAAYRRFWDGDLDTRWTTGVYLPPLVVNVTMPNSSTQFMGFAPTRSDLYALRLNVTSGNTKSIQAHTYDETTDTFSSGSVRVAFFASASGVYGDTLVVGFVTYFALVATGNIRIGTAGPGVDSVDLDDGIIVESTVDPSEPVRLISGDMGVAIVFDRNGGAAIYRRTADDTWTTQPIGSVTAGGGVFGAAVLPGVDGQDKIYICTVVGLTEIDPTGATWPSQSIDRMFANPWNGYRMVVHQGALYYQVGVPNDQQFTLRRLTNSSGARLIEDMSVPDDGLPGDALGPITWMTSYGDQLFVAVGGHQAGQHARVLVLLSDETWHIIYRRDTANQIIKAMTLSDRADGILRLHLLVDDQDDILEFPSSHPESGASIPRAASGSIILPVMDAGLPGFDKAWFFVLINAGGLNETDNVIGVDYEDTSGAWIDIGDITSANNRLLFPGGGLARDRLRLRLRPERGDTVTDSPVLENLVIAVNPEITTYRYRFQVNVEQTAKVFSSRGSTILAQLREAAASTSLVPMSYADDAMTMVDITEYREMTRPAQPESLQAPWGNQVGYVEIIATERYEQR